MRILHVVEAIEGGVALHVRLLVEAQVARGDDVHVALPGTRVWGLTDQALARRLDELGVPAHFVTMHRTAPHPRNLPAARRLDAIIRSVRPDVVHTHSTAAGAVARPVARARRVPVVHTPHGEHFGETKRGLVPYLALTTERLVARASARVIAVSDSEAKVLRLAYRDRAIAVIPNGFPADPEPLPPFPDPPAVVAVNRLIGEKDPEFVVRVMAAARAARPGTRALIVGYGPLEGAVRSLAASLDPGIEVRDDLPGVDAIACSTLVLMASRREGGPYVVLEAMNAGRPVVGSDVVGLRDSVVAGETGLLYPLGDVDAATAAVVALLDDPARAAAMGAAGRRRLVERHDPAAMAEAVAAVYAEVTAGGARRRAAS